MASVEEKIEKLIQKPIEDLGYSLYDVNYVKEGKDYFLRIFIDQEEKGIDLNDCEKVSDVINPLLDKEDVIKEMYFLEVSSPGIERIIRKEKHLEENKGKEIEVNLFKTLENKKVYDGILEKWDEENIYIIENEKQIIIERKNISLMKLKYHWN